MIEKNKVYLGDCLEIMKGIEEGSIDLILCDLPYGVTNCKWDNIIRFDKLWELYNKIIKDTGVIALFGIEPFSSYLRLSNKDYYKYDWIWEKTGAHGFYNAKNRPLTAHENISIFSKGAITHRTRTKRRSVYNPQMERGKPYRKTKRKVHAGESYFYQKVTRCNLEYVGTTINNDGSRYPRSVIKFSNYNVGGIHPTQKPLALIEYLIRTYSEEGELILDNCAGSFTTAVACDNLKRNWIGIEKEKSYCHLGLERINKNRSWLKLDAVELAVVK